MTRTALNIHENFAINLAYKDSVMWDAYTPEQFSLFRKKIDELFRDQGSSNQNKALNRIRDNVYQSTINQTKYTNGNLLSTFILVTVSEGNTLGEAMSATKFSIHLLIRTRKCKNSDDSSNCCMVFIDEMGNVYRNWNHFKTTNCLPEGLALAPRNGVYQFDSTSSKLLLNAWMTRSSPAASELVNTTDTAAGFMGLAATVGIVASMAFPVILPAVPLLVQTTTLTGGYSALRSAYHLWSRSEHEQSISITNASARGSWIGVASGTLAVSSSVANKSLSKLASAGKEISLARELVVNGMNISTLLLSGTGVAHGILDLILKANDDETINGLDVLQVAASLAIFTHSTYNFRLASTIVNQARDSKVKSYRTELSNRQRKMFDKLYKESVRTQGPSKGKMDVIRLMNEIPDKQYLNDLNRINKELNKNNIRFTAGQNGEILLNNEVQVKPGDLRNSIQYNKGENVLNKVNQPIPDSHQSVPNTDTLNTLTRYAFSTNIKPFEHYFQSIAQRILSGDNFLDCVRHIIIELGEDVTNFIIQKSQQFIENYGQQIENLIRSTVYFDTVVWNFYKICKQKLLEFTRETINNNLKSIFKELLDFYDRQCFVASQGVKNLKCEYCEGYYQIPI